MATCAPTLARARLVQEVEDRPLGLLQAVFESLVADRLLTGCQVVDERLELVDFLALLVHLPQKTPAVLAGTELVHVNPKFVELKLRLVAQSN